MSQRQWNAFDAEGKRFLFQRSQTLKNSRAVWNNHTYHDLVKPTVQVSFIARLWASVEIIKAKI